MASQNAYRFNINRFKIPYRWQGAFLKILSCACFAVINGLIRALTKGVYLPVNAPLSAATLAFFQNIFGTLFLLPFFFRLDFTFMVQKYHFLHLLRIITAVLGVYFWYLTLHHMPITEAVALSFTSPIFTLLIAWYFLHEKLDWQRLLAVILSLFGAFLISRPDQVLLQTKGGVGILALLPCTSSLLLAVNKILTRKLTALGESVTLLAIYLLFFMIPISLLLALFDWSTPLLSHYPWLILLGALTAAAHLSFIKAYSLADVTFLTPFSLSKFFFSVAVGYLAFAEFPTQYTVWIGSIIVLCSILILAFAPKKSTTNP